MLNDDALTETLNEIREAERRAIVKWLREQAEREGAFVATCALRSAADAVEEGWHREPDAQRGTP